MRLLAGIIVFLFFLFAWPNHGSSQSHSQSVAREVDILFFLFSHVSSALPSEFSPFHVEDGYRPEDSPSPCSFFFFCRFLQVRLFPILPHSRVRARESCPPTKSSHPSTLATAIVPHATCVCTFSAAQPFGPFGGVSLAACEWTFDSEYMLVTVANVVWGCFQ